MERIRGCVRQSERRTDGGARRMLGDVPGRALPGADRRSALGRASTSSPDRPAVTERNTDRVEGNFTVDGVGKTGVLDPTWSQQGVSPNELIEARYSRYRLHEDETKERANRSPPYRPARRASTWSLPATTTRRTDRGRDRPRATGNKPIKLETIVKIGDSGAGGECGQTFKAFGEVVSLSSNGRHERSGGTWGSETYDVEAMVPE